MRTHYKTISPQFIPDMLAGVKTTTIRPEPKRDRDWPRPGDTIQFRRWTGRPYHSKQAEVARVRVVLSFGVTVTESGPLAPALSAGHPILVPFGDPDAIAKRDGFASWAEMREWFRTTHGLPFSGIMIEWEPPKT